MKTFLLFVLMFLVTYSGMAFVIGFMAYQPPRVVLWYRDLNEVTNG